MAPVLDAHTQTCAIFGHPVGHSLSPAIHNAAFGALGLNLVYVAHDVAPENLAAAMAGIRALGYRGLSITIPHKVSALNLVDEVDDTAQRIGCINTVVNEVGVLKGYNTDGLGALGALRAADLNLEQASVVVLGSGGAARAIAVTSTPRRLSPTTSIAAAWKRHSWAPTCSCTRPPLVWRQKAKTASHPQSCCTPV
jgi:shikimate dehydrogenase